jgi:hypothetical protein
MRFRFIRRAIVKQSVQVAQIVAGEPVSVRELSVQRERSAVASAVATVAALFAIGLGLAAVGFATTLERAVFVPGLLVVWALAGAFVAWRVARRVRHRASRYWLGTALDADAFAPTPFSLVRRTGDRFELTLMPGMRGRIEMGRAPLPIEALLEAEPASQSGRCKTFPLEGDVFAEIAFGGSTFVVRSSATSGADEALRLRTFWSGYARPAARVAGLALPLVFVASAFFTVGAPHAIVDRPYRATTPKASTPWEAEKFLRMEAQMQARSLHQCFDPLPLSCQRPGFIGVGLSLARDGEIRSNWIARSTYGRECPVSDCMRNVVSSWSFDPLPSPMRVVLPVQVLRTEKPLPLPRPAEAAVITSAADVVLDWSSSDGRR